MASNSGKFRFVRCPKCLQLLIEYSTVPLYRCGGCGTVLKAKNKNPDGESPGLNIEETQNHPNISSENVSPDSLSVFSTEPNNTPSSSNTHPSSDPSEDELIKANPFAKISPIKQNLDANVHPLEHSEGERKATDDANNSPAEEICDPNENQNECTHNVEDERDEMQTAQSVLSEEDVMSRCSNAYDGSVSSSDEGKININIHDRSYYLQKSRRTFRKKAPPLPPGGGSGDRRKEKEGLPPRPPNEKFPQGVSLDSSDFEIIQSLIENRANLPSLIDRYKKFDHSESLRKMDELRDKLNTFAIQREGGESQSPLCFDSLHNNRSEQLIRSHYPCLHCTNNNGLHRPSSRNLLSAASSSSFPGSPISVDSSSTREKRILTRKHICRPIFGGTPYVICENCFSLLQVPSTVLISKKRLIELECGKCNEIITTPLPSKKFMNKRGSPDHIRDNIGVEGDAGFFARSYSIGGESEFNGEDGDREAALSSLHRLMGYNSATELLYSRADRGYDSFESMVPHSRTRGRNA